MLANDYCFSVEIKIKIISDFKLKSILNARYAHIERSHIQGGLLPLKKEMKNVLMLLFLKQFIELTN